MLSARARASQPVADAVSCQQTLMLSRPLTLSTASAHCPGPWIPTPAFGSASRHSRSTISHRGVFSDIGRVSPLREMISAAYTVGQHSIADDVAERCPVRLSSQRLRSLEACPVKKVIPGTRRWRGGALGFHRTSTAPSSMQFVRRIASSRQQPHCDLVIPID